MMLRPFVQVLRSAMANSRNGIKCSFQAKKADFELEAISYSTKAPNAEGPQGMR
jgi:hypothetical protein